MGMSLRKKTLVGFVAAFLIVTVLFVVCIGPWPTYSSGFEGTGYFTQDLASIDRNAQLNKFTANPGRLQAGWGACLMNPEPGLPMAGYGARHNPLQYFFGGQAKYLATGVHDDLHVKALALSDGVDTTVIVGADLLLVPPNVAEAVRREVAKQTPLTANNILFGASHTHDSLGAWGPGIAAFVTGGKFDPKVVTFLTNAFTQAVVEAYKNLGPAKMAHGGFDAAQFIRNRARKAPIDTRLSYLVVEKQDGKRCMLLRYSAHPTTVGHRFAQYTAEYPGFLQSALEKALPNTTVEYLGGSLGSSGPNAPEGPSDIERAQAMGEELAKLVLANVNPANLKWQTNVDIASIGIPLEPPPFQLRVTQKLRLSPLLPKILGVPHEAWMQSVRIGDLVLVGLPGDFSGEISADWAGWAAEKGYDLWPSSFGTAYLGYISPDKYYNLPGATKEYETGLMSWTGPHQEAFFTALMKRMFEDLTSQAAG
jgi:hypothetical protein